MMRQAQRVGALGGDIVEIIAMKLNLKKSLSVKIRSAGIDRLDAVNCAIDSTEVNAIHAQIRQTVALAIGFKDQKGKGWRDIAA